MNTITVTYTLKYQLDFAPEYKWTKCNRCFNVKSGREIKQTTSKGSIGYCIKGRFYSLTRLRQSLVRIEKSDCPF